MTLLISNKNMFQYLLKYTIITYIVDVRFNNKDKLKKIYSS